MQQPISISMELSNSAELEWASPSTDQWEVVNSLSGDEEEDGSESEPENEMEDIEVTLKKSKIEVKQLRSRLYKRSAVIESIKNSYLKDIVAMKHVFERVMNDQQKQEIMAEWRHALPSVDLRAALALHAPSLTHLSVKPCKRCGGCLDIEFHDSAKSEQLMQQLRKMKDRNEELRLIISKQNLQVDRTIQENNSLTSKFELEVCIGLLHEVRKI